MQYTQGKHLVLIDDCDAYLLKQYYCHIIKAPVAHTHYVALSDKKTGLYAGLLHRLIMALPKYIKVDHQNGNGLDCQRKNLRAATGSQNQRNRRRSVNLVKGVYWRKDRQCWTARITVEYRVIVLGCFKTHEEAIKARIKAEDCYFGEFAGNGTDQ